MVDELIAEERFISQKLGPELMIYDKVQDLVHVLNETASLIKGLHDRGYGVEQIEVELRKRHSIKPDQEIRGDIINILAELNQKDLIKAAIAIAL